MVSPVYKLLQSSSSMAAINSHSISKLPLPFSNFSTKTHFSKFNSSSFISHNSFPSLITTTTTTTTHLFLNSTKQRHVSAVVSFSLPTKNPESAVAEKLPKWSWRAIKSFAMGELEARKLKYATTGTEAILMGILVEGTSLAAKFLWENGITLFKVRDESVKLREKGDFFFFSPEHPPLTESAQKALDRAVDVKLKSGVDGEITPTELLLGIWSEVESPGHKILAALGFDDEKAKQLQALSSKPGFAEES
ncbi:ATP-dependent Clp protease ATP-binding subunit CLPT2, chloroplastic [Silene latifolia]|uniref:ATP-dependent Clp protease ATP-binding subunit CLPT2, chloroplastic n=1 Tax=Silene latifolia TaxID=37657 RepID=UPI003D77CB6C